ncbi:MAG: ABC transporter ATP-binding protein [Desulfobulbaceae bacterium BRH_c16a]|nr:MAG: ABC transporter ATP-binding protein [Desulfobulbaceae bacterium BRH_c16a]
MMDYGYSEEGREASLGDLHLWRRILRFTAPYRIGLIGAVIISLLITWATLTLPYLVQTAIDNSITATHLPAGERLSGLARNAMSYGFIIGLVFVASFCQILVLEWVGQSVMHSVRQQLFQHLLDLDLPFFNTHRTGQLVTRLTNDIQNMNEMFTSVIVTLFNDSLRLLGILALLFWMNPRLAAVMSIFVPLSLVITILFARLARERFRAIRSQLAKLNSFLSESLSGIAILQLFGRQETSRQTHENLSAGFLDRTLSQIRLFGTFMPLTEFLSSAAVALILWYGGGEVIRQRMTLGELVAFISYMRLFFQPLRELSQKYSVVQSAMASAERIFQLLDTRSTIPLPAKPVRLSNTRGKLEFKGLTFGYEPDNPILHDISLTLRPGQTVALVGTTGSGKSTLVNLLLRFYMPQAGRITIDDTDIADLDMKELRTLVGVILQDVLILQDSLFANIVMDTGCSREEVEGILHRTGMNRFVEKLPRGLDTPIGEGGTELSTGEKQLLSFARVLCRNPAILVLDEATAAIDTESENILEQAIADSFKGRTSLVIAHRLSTIRRADHIIVMAHGKIVEQGSHEELLGRNGHYALLVAMDLHNGNHIVNNLIP